MSASKEAPSWKFPHHENLVHPYTLAWSKYPMHQLGFLSYPPPKLAHHRCDILTQTHWQSKARHWVHRNCMCYWFYKNLFTSCRKKFSIHPLTFSHTLSRRYLNMPFFECPTSLKKTSRKSGAPVPHVVRWKTTTQPSPRYIINGPAQLRHKREPPSCSRVLGSIWKLARFF